MRRALRWLGYLAGGLLLILLLAAAYLWIASSQKFNARVPAKPEPLAAPTAAQLADGPRQLRILGCVSCHGEGLRGKTMFEEPKVGSVHAPNLTLVAAQVSDQQLAQAIRQGIGHDGRALLIMPSAEYQHLTDAETAALVATIRAQPKGGRQMPRVEPGPLMRFALVTGKLRMQPEQVEHHRLNMPAELGPQFARGRHIALTACSECHGPTFAGGEPQPGLKAPDLTIVGAYDLAAFTGLMRTGVPPDGRDLRMMDDVARDDFRHLRDEEIAALHAYLVERAQRAP